MLSVVVPPLVEPVTIDDAMLWCRVDANEELPLLDSLIATARARAEHLTQRVFVQRTLQLTAASFSAPTALVQAPIYRTSWFDPWNRWSSISTPTVYPLSPLPVIAVTAVSYLDAAGVAQVLDPSAWTFDDTGLTFVTASTLPVIANRPDAVRITFTAGYPPVVVDGVPDYRIGLPPELITWMHMNIASWYGNREAFVLGPSFTALPHSLCDGLLDSLILASRFA